jgi:pimeloyl-ACP methyl ester carboxylesterase
MLMLRNLIAERCAQRLSRRAAVTRFAGASAALAVTASGLDRDVAVGAISATSSTEKTTQEGMFMTTTTADVAPITVVLIHGAFADAAGWSGVIERLQGAGMVAIAPPNPLRGVAHDAAYIASFLSQIPGKVLLVGHSYGGVVITNAASKARNVVGLVYVAAFAPDEGEGLLQLASDSRDSILVSALNPYQYPTGSGDETAVEFLIKPEKYHETFAADLPEEQTVVMATTQRPIAELAFSEVTGTPAWKTLPSWAVVATGDKAAGSDIVRSMAERAGATATEVEGSHAIMVSQPKVVADVILAAAAAVG